MEAAKAEQGGRRAISTKKLTPEERKNRTFDFLGGFEIIDDDFRLFVIEGLSAGAMKRLEELIPRSEPNSEIFKILKNSDEVFQERAYLDFDLELKRVKHNHNIMFTFSQIKSKFFNACYDSDYFLDTVARKAKRHPCET